MKIIFRKQFKEGWNYITKSSNYIYAVAIIFIFSALIGFFYAENFSFFDEILKGLIDRTAGMNLTELTLFIFQNNFQASLIGMVLGIFLGIFPIINSLTNGALIGYVLNKVWLVSGFGDFWRLLPHGIFELPAIFISLGLGIKLGFSLFSADRNLIKDRFYNSLNSFLFIVLPLLIIAAIIEGSLIALI